MNELKREDEQLWNILWGKLSRHKDSNGHSGWDYVDPREDMYLAQIVEGGVFSNEHELDDELPKSFMRGNCHQNTVNFMQSEFSQPGDMITVGYALVSGSWIQHTYITDITGTAVEATHGFTPTCHYGYCLAPDEQRNFIKDSQEMIPHDNPLK